MDIDGILAIAIFVLIVSWSFTFYYGLFAHEDDIQQYTIDTTAGKIMNYITVDTYKIPVTFTSQQNLTDHVFYFRHIWDVSGNSTMVYDENGTQVSCEFFNDTIYWMSDITAGHEYYFEVRYAAGNLPKNCTKTTYHNAVNKTKVVPWAEEKTVMISQYMMNQMNGTNYYQFRSEQDISDDFRLEVLTGSNSFVYGIPVPSNRNVFALTFKRPVWESGEDSDITLNIW
ncbi:MAG: hypothetical protein GXO64_01170 [Candidatus Micrarchaeota archaeon]|nr:hypothetical protein [Candidatus Micrarchaeota archaeon]